MTHPCLFCKIIHKEIPATIVYEDETLLAFKDIHPQAPIHQLIIPKLHIATLNDASDALLLGKMMQLASQLAKEQYIAEEGYRVVVNCNASGGQEVFHLHLHLLGSRQMTWPPG